MFLPVSDLAGADEDPGEAPPASLAVHSGRSGTAVGGKGWVRACFFFSG